MSALEQQGGYQPAYNQSHTMNHPEQTQHHATSQAPPGEPYDDYEDSRSPGRNLAAHPIYPTSRSLLEAAQAAAEMAQVFENVVDRSEPGRAITEAADYDILTGQVDPETRAYMSRMRAYELQKIAQETLAPMGEGEERGN